MASLPNPPASGGPREAGRWVSAFTLVEILVVIGITAVLFFLLLGPLVNSFRLTQRAQMLTAAQDAGRRTLEILTRELGSAAYVFDNTSHPFSGQVTSAQIAAASVQYDQFTNFLDIDVPVDPSTNPPAPGTVPAHAYNAKLDFVLPRHNSSGGLIDPTTGEPISITSGSSAPTGLTFPLAPSVSMVRYWVGRRDPTRVYATHGEGGLLSKNGNNTYFLYRAQFTPYITTTTTTGGKTTTTTAVNSDLFTTRTDATGKVLPEFDDPDFFRNVTPGQDVNWLSADHHYYTAAEAYGAGGTATSLMPDGHNYRVQKWIQLAKPVISSPQTDLILLPHNRDNSINYNTVASLPNVAASGAVYDPVATDPSPQPFPTVNTSVTFRFGSISADASAASNADYAGAGYGSDAAANGGLPFVPTVYKATEQSWAFPYHISLYQYNNSTQSLFDVQVANTSDATYMYQAGDLVEMYNNAPVYDVTTGAALGPSPTTLSMYYVPMIVTPDSATINFDTPALPTPANPYNRFWQIPAASFTDPVPPATETYPNPNLPAEIASGVLDLTNTLTFANSPLPGVAGGTLVAPQVANARIVPGSVRVYGPDASPGPNQGLSTPYTEAFPGGTFGPNQFQVNYAANTLTLYVDPATKQLPQAPSGTTASVNIAFDYQANFAPTASAISKYYDPITAANPASPYEVKVDYQTRDLIDVNLGVRVYDPNNVGPADVVTVHNQVRIGNSNR